MELKKLYGFLLVAEKQNISHAAKALGISQPALSRQLSELETELGKPLLIRGNKNTTLTADGLFLAERAREILALVKQTEAAFHTRKDFSPVLRVGFSDSPHAKTILDALEKLKSLHPEIGQILKNQREEKLLALLKDGLLDFALLSMAPDEKIFDFLPLETGAIWGIFSSYEQKGTELANEIPLYFLCPAAEKIAASLFPNQKKIRSDSLFSLRLLIQENRAFALLPSDIFNPKENDFSFLPLRPPKKAVSYFAWKRKKNLTPAEKEFLRFFQ